MQNFGKNNTKFTGLVVSVAPWVPLKHIVALRQLHLDSVKSAPGFAVVSCGPTTLETTIAYHAIVSGRSADALYRRFDFRVTTAPAIRTDIEIGEPAVE